MGNRLDKLRTRRAALFMDHESQEAVPPRRLPWFWILLALGAGTLAIVLKANPSLPLPTRNDGGTHPAVGKRLNSLSLRPLTFAGDPLTLDELQGKVVVLNFWGTWCPPCRLELPHVAELAHRYRDSERCRVLAVSCGASGPDPVSALPELHMETRQLLDDTHLELPAYADPEGRTRRALVQSAQLQDFGYPTIVVFDGQGVIRGLWTGYAPGLEREIESLVASLIEKST